LSAVIRVVDLESMLPYDVPTKDQSEAIKARNKLVEHNMRLVVKMAKWFLRFGSNYEDLIQSGATGLLLAAVRYNPTKFDVRFTTYAGHWIYQRFQGETYGSLIHVPRNLKVEIVKRNLDPKYIADPKLSDTLIDRADKAIAFQEIDDSSLARHSAINPFQSRVDDLEAVDVALSSLGERFREIVKHRFGIGTTEKTLEEIGNIMGITKERVRQLEARAIKTMRSKLKLTA
jgi:RNA polymerase sigma factor (sigma-70 family)